MSALFKSKLEKSILTVAFSDPSSRNALSLQAARELFEIITTQKFEALILTAEGRVFCSGGHLTDYAAMTTAEQGQAVNDEIRLVLAELASLNRPTIAVLNGDAFGGGVELASSFDFVIAAPHVMLALWQRKIGLSFGWGGGARIERRIGSANLRSLSLSTDALTAHNALAIGLIDEVVQESQLLGRALSLATQLASLPQEPIAAAKGFSASDETKAFKALWWNKSHRAILGR